MQCSLVRQVKLTFKPEETKKDKPPVESNWATLKAHRKANGLCFVCGEKWTGRNHKCPNQVPRHVIQELRDVFFISGG